jgi:hypothetical protein
VEKTLIVNAINLNYLSDEIPKRDSYPFANVDSKRREDLSFVHVFSSSQLRADSKKMFPSHRPFFDFVIYFEAGKRKRRTLGKREAQAASSWTAPGSRW